MSQSLIYSLRFAYVHFYHYGSFKTQKPLFSDFRSSRPDVFCEKVFLEISQNSQESTCARVSSLIKLQASGY